MWRGASPSHWTLWAQGSQCGGANRAQGFQEARRAYGYLRTYAGSGVWKGSPGSALRSQGARFLVPSGYRAPLILHWTAAEVLLSLQNHRQRILPHTFVIDVEVIQMIAPSSPGNTFFM